MKAEWYGFQNLWIMSFHIVTTNIIYLVFQHSLIPVPPTHILVKYIFLILMLS